MLRKVRIGVLLALVSLLCLIIFLTMESNALSVKSNNTTALKVVDSSSQLNTGKTILQPTFNPQQQ